jgi:hypothetical protein
MFKRILKFIDRIKFSYKIYSKYNLAWFFSKGFKFLNIFAKFFFIIRIFQYLLRFVSLVNLLFVFTIFILYTSFDPIILFINFVADYYQIIYDFIINKYSNLLKFIQNWIESKLDKVDTAQKDAPKKLDKSNFELKRKNKNLDIDSSVELDKDHLKRTNDYKNVEVDKETSASQKSYKKYYILAGILLIGGGVFLYYNPDIIAGALAAITSIRDEARNLTWNRNPDVPPVDNNEIQLNPRPDDTSAPNSPAPSSPSSIASDDTIKGAAAQLPSSSSTSEPPHLLFSSAMSKEYDQFFVKPKDK